MPSITIDRQDLALLEAIQRDAQATNTTLGESVHLSPSQVSRRLQRLAEAGIVTGHAALLDQGAVGLGVTAFAHVTLERHGKTQSEAFEAAAAGLPEVLDCHAVSGDADYLLRIVATDLPAFSDTMMKRILRLPGVAQVRTHIVLQTVKRSHVLPLEHLARPRQNGLRVDYASGGR